MDALLAEEKLGLGEDDTFGQENRQADLVETFDDMRTNHEGFTAAWARGQNNYGN